MSSLRCSDHGLEIEQLAAARRRAPVSAATGGSRQDIPHRRLGAQITTPRASAHRAVPQRRTGDPEGYLDQSIPSGSAGPLIRAGCAVRCAWRPTVRACDLRR